MDPGEQTTGTRDEHYNLVSVLYHALHGAANCETYALDAEAAGRDDLVTYFREAQVVQAGMAERAKELLGIGGVAPETEELLLVAEVMTPEVVTIEPSASIADAAKRMIQQEKGPLPVVEGDRPVGMVTDRDIIARVVAEERDPGSLTVGDIATRELVTIGSDQDVDEAARLMDEHQLDRILVVEGEKLVGIISEADLRIDEGPLA